MAIQNLSWGFMGIFAGMVADKFGAFRVIALGAVVYGVGLLGMAWATDPWVFALFTGVIIGTALILVLRNVVTLVTNHSNIEFAIIGAVILAGVVTDELVKRYAIRRRAARELAQ
jgi:MFS family permease